MKIQFVMIALGVLTCSLAANAACPKNKKEWQAKGPKLFLENALPHIQDGMREEVSAWSNKIGKKGAAISASALPFKERTGEFVMVQVQSTESKDSLLLGGVLKCDVDRKEPVLLSLSWVKGDKSGMVKLNARTSD